MIKIEQSPVTPSVSNCANILRKLTCAKELKRHRADAFSPNPGDRTRLGFFERRLLAQFERPADADYCQDCAVAVVDAAARARRVTRVHAGDDHVGRFQGEIRGRPPGLLPEDDVALPGLVPRVREAVGGVGAEDQVRDAVSVHVPRGPRTHRVPILSRWPEPPR